MGQTAAYIRVSTQDQQTQGTPEDQRKQIADFCQGRGIEVDEWLEEAESGANSDRPEFNRLKAGVTRGNYSTVIVASQDRLSRSALQTHQFIDVIKKANANLYIIRHNIAIKDGIVDPQSQMLVSLIAMFAENERETIKFRTMAGKERKQRSGKWVTGQAPFGYELDRQSKILKVNKDEAEICTNDLQQ